MNPNLLSSIVSSIDEGIIAIDKNYKILFFNQTIQQITGFTNLSDALGKPINQVIKFCLNAEELDPNYYCTPTEQSQNHIIFKHDNLDLIGTNGSNCPVKLKVYQSEQALKNGVWRILTIHNKEEETELEDMKLDFVSMAAHELRTPLTAIKSYLYVFTRDYSPNFDDEQNMFLNRINISAQKLISLVENLLNVSRIERGAFTINIESLDWIEKINEATTEIANQAKDKKIQVIFTPPTYTIPKVKADRLRIAEVLANLLTNAITYTPPQGKIMITVTCENNQIITAIKDTGEGIPKEALPHLFTKFFRVSGKLEQGSKGTGLGLFISKSIIDLHHGKIWVESKLGEGSTFFFSLPTES